MSKLSLVDTGFLLTESPNSPKHVGVVQIWRLPKGRGAAWLRRLLADLKQEEAGFPFDQKLEEKIPLQPELVPDENIDMDYHVRHTVLPHPGDDEQLWKMVSRLHGHQLDRRRPLWEFHLIEGLSDRRFAFYTKIHHALADGLTLSRWFSESGADGPDDHSSPAIWHGQKRRNIHEGREPTYANLIGEGIRVLGGGVRTALDMTTLTLRLINRRFFEKNRSITLPLSAHKTPLNVVPGAARLLTATTYSLQTVKNIAHRNDVTVNDVLLTICDLAINRYFKEKGAELEAPLVVYMPVSLRARGDTEAGNLVSLLQVRLASEMDQPLEALQQIKESSLAAREVFSGFGKPAIQLYALTVALLSMFEESLKLDKVLPPVQNLVISNVPGPKKTLWFRGAEGLNAYPISTLPPMTALNVTANSYAGVMHVGLVADRTALPDLDRLIAHMDVVYQELSELT